MIISVADPSQVAAARRAAADFTQRHGVADAAAGAVALIVTEMATNLIKHAERGEIIISRYDDGSGTGTELLSLDKGPGIADVPKARADGYSTAGSPGTGLGAIRRQATDFDIYSRPGLGTAMVARVRDGSSASPPGPVIGAVAAPYPGETVCGDAWAFDAGAGKPTVLVVDGSGHGAAAQTAASAAVEAFRLRSPAAAVLLVEDLHRALAPTRGAAVAVAQVDRGRRVVAYVGVGNISAALVTATGTRRMVSHNGTAGYVAARIREFTYPYDGGAGTILLHSDGIGTHWDFAQYPGLAMTHPSLLAGVLYRDHRRPRDDATVVAVRLGDGRA